MDVYGQQYEVEVRVLTHFQGKHSLPVRPELHHHVWEVELSVSGPLDPETGMVCDMVELGELLKPHVMEMDQWNLHEFPGFQNQPGLIGLAAKYPTCDTIAHYLLWKMVPEFKANARFKGLRISQIKVGIFEPDGQEPWGHAIIKPKDR